MNEIGPLDKETAAFEAAGIEITDCEWQRSIMMAAAIVASGFLAGKTWVGEDTTVNNAFDKFYDIISVRMQKEISKREQ